MRDKVAKSSKVYINPDTFEINPRIVNAVAAPDALEIYSAQLSYWIQSDVVAAVKEANAAATGTADAIVKHLIRVRTKPYGQVSPFFITGPDGQANASADAAMPKIPQASTTGRVSNGLYDVFHFELEADVEEARLPDFLRALGTRRFITPLHVDWKAKDNATALAEGHVYGNKSVVNVRAECEVLYLRAWNQAFMPERLKTKLGITAEAAPGTTPPADGAAATPAAATEDAATPAPADVPPPAPPQ
jgi:hypothetical protein